MVLCEQFVFTSSKLEDGGYQVIAKSSGITDDILEELEEYLYPIGIETSGFRDSKSMRVLQDKIAFIQSKNIGIGQDGRPDTMYSHIIVMKKEDFKKFGNDSRIFNEYFLETTEFGHLTPLSIENKKFDPDFTCVDVIGIIQVQKCLSAVFKNKKIAIINEKNQKLIQSILSILPPSLSLKSFSTQVPKPNVQTKFDIIQTTEKNDYVVDKYTIIDVTGSSSSYTENKTMIDICVDYLIEIIDKKKETVLKRIHEEFESLPIKNIDEKIILIIGNLLLESKKSISFKKQVLENILQIVGEIPPDTTRKYWNQIRGILSPEEYQKYALEYEIKEIINEHEIENITLDILHSMFSSLKNNYPEQRKTLLNEVYKLETKKFLRDVKQLIINSNHSMYGTEILEFIIEQNRFKSILCDLLINDEILSIVERQSKYDDVVSISSKINRKLSIELLSNPIFNFGDEYESQKFKYLLQRFNKNLEKIEECEESLVGNMVEQVFEKILASENLKPSSGTMNITTQNLRQLLAIIEELQNILNKIIENTENSEIKNNCNNLQIKFTEFIKSHPIPKERPKRWLFWDIFGLYE